MKVWKLTAISLIVVILVEGDSSTEDSSTSSTEDMSLEVTTTTPRDNTESSESKSDSSDERADELTVDTRRRKGKKANPGKRGPSGGKVNVISGNLPSKQRKKGKGSLSSHKASGGGRKEANSHVPKVTEPPLITFDPTQHPNWKLFEKDRCGLGSRDRIIGGQDAEPGWYPWIARIGYLSNKVDIPLFRCGAVLVSKFYIVTAAHCVTNLPNRLRV
uniref:Peptidase S1 domain-containing protein n=1 Tax=Timema monikensis TaxID=170555 RepID=A0A7R9E8Y7_9NEOP|nr:unnamed protein product [Timema monikensis]